MVGEGEPGSRRNWYYLLIATLGVILLVAIAVFWWVNYIPVNQDFSESSAAAQNTSTPESLDRTPSNTSSPPHSSAVPTHTVELQSTTVLDSRLPNLPRLSGEVVLWHTFPKGSPEETVLTNLIAKNEQNNPDLCITSIQVPSGDILRNYVLGVIDGEGPDILIAPNENLGDWARNDLVLKLDRYLHGELDDIRKKAIDGVTVDGGIYGIPFTEIPMVMFFNKSGLESAPRTTSELLQTVADGQPMVVVLSPYHLFSWSMAFGGEVIDSDGICIADKGGWVDYLHFLLNLKESGMVLDQDYQLTKSMFLSGDAKITIDGVWSFDEYEQVLGEHLGVLPLPAGPVGPASPFNTLVGIYINPQSRVTELAVHLVLDLAEDASKQEFTDVRGFVPVGLHLNIDDTTIQVLLESAEAGFPIPQSEDFSNYWVPFTEMFNHVLAGEISPEEGLIKACAAMDEANGKLKDGG